MTIIGKNTTVGRLAPLFIILSGACWGIIGLFTKRLALCGCTALQIAFLRCGAAASLLWLYLLLFDRQKLKIRLRDLWMFFGTGIFSLTLFSVLYFTTIEYTGLSVAAVLLYTAPIFVMIMSALFFGEKITARKALALLIAFMGCIFTTGLVSSLAGSGISGLSPVGILTGISSGVGYALYSIFGNVALRKYSSVTVTAYTFLFAALGLAPFCLNGRFLLLLKSFPVLKAGLGAALISTIAPYLLYTLGLKYTQPGKASVMAFSEPVVATLLGVIAFHEVLTVSGVAGILLIFVSIVVLNTGKAQPAE